MRSVRSYQREITKLKAILSNVEWYCAASNSSPSCPNCGSQKHWGHTAGCELGKLFAVSGDDMNPLRGAPHK